MRARVLVVEDNLDLLEVLGEALAEEYQVETARRGEEAVARALVSPPDVVLLDLQLPGLDGVAAGRMIKRLLWPRRVPILVLTARAAEGEAEVRASGCCDDYLAKPAPYGEIRERVARLLEVSPPGV
jgi:two-component system phosphate regulon response regulator PhoB